MIKQTDTQLDTEDSAETNADRIIEGLRNLFVEGSTDADDPEEGLRFAAVAVELDSRLAEPEFTSRLTIDPRELVDTDHEVAADQLLTDIVCDIGDQAPEVHDQDTLESLLGVAAEIHTRIGGGS